MSGINKVILIGNLGADPDVRQLPSGDAVANVRIATSESWRDKQTGEKQERTDWHNVVFFGKLAEIVQQYVRKGSKLYVEGKLRTRKWQDQGGQDRYTTEVVVDAGGAMQMLDSRSAGGGDQGRAGDRWSSDGGDDGGTPPPPRSAARPPSAALPSSDNDDIDDIPF